MTQYWCSSFNCGFEKTKQPSNQQKVDNNQHKPAKLKHTKPVCDGIMVGKNENIGSQRELREQERRKSLENAKA